MIVSPQIIVFLDLEGKPHAELPSANGARQRVELSPDWTVRNPELMSALNLLREQQRIESERKLNELRKNNISYVARSHPSYGATASTFTEQIWPDAERQFARRVKRHLTGSAGNLGGTKKINLDNLI